MNIKKLRKHIFDDLLSGKTFDELWNIALPDMTIAGYRFLLYFKKSIDNLLMQGRKIEAGETIKLSKPISIHVQTSDDTDYCWDGNINLRRV